MAVLNRTHPTLATECYSDPAIYRRELEAIWFRDWFCVGRASDWPQTGDYRLVTFGDQNIVVLRDEQGKFRAFHNTCRHRGAVLCELEQGRFASGRVVCPYHAWTYALDGSLQATPRRVPAVDFDANSYSLYSVHVDQWRGFVFINLAGTPPRSLSDALAPDAATLASWPLDEQCLAHRETHTVACNWKLFWENYFECYHCPGVHPELSRLVPVYGMGLLGLDEDPGFDPGAGIASAARVAPGKHTWSADGELRSALLAGVAPAMIEDGMRFATFLPSLFVVAHRDYVRSMRVRPLGPEAMEICIDWLVGADVDLRTLDVARLTEFARTVFLQDARVCELAQRGMRCREHKAGVLVPQEYDVLAFDQWVQARLLDAAAAIP